jgi:2,3-bisphosphoglycerate-independent phosphoglycerate mutase
MSHKQTKIKYIILLGDGMADFPIESLNNRTPLAAAETPAMDRVAATGISGLFHPIPPGLPAGSDVGNLSCFGYDPVETYTGRAPIEAASRQIKLGPNDIALRCNLVTISQDDTMESFTAGHITSEEGAAIIQTLNERITDYPIQFHNGVGYRHLGILTAEPKSIEELDNVDCTPPHNIAEQPIENYLPNGPGSSLFRDLMKQSKSILADHPVNQERISNGQLPATTIWLWGQGRTPSLTSYREQFNLAGSVISAVDIVKGVGTLASLDIIDVPGATGYLDTDYEGKVAAALHSLTESDFTYIHVEAPDETAHEGRADLKVQAIEDFDSRVVQPCLAYLDDHPNTRILVCPDHITSVQSKAHEDGPVPFAMCGTGIEPNAVSAYTETDGLASGVNVDPGFKLIRQFLMDAAINESDLKS